MTTTGGRGDVDLGAPAVGPVDGDDIEVLPDASHSTSRGRMRAFLVGAIVVVLVAAGITVAAVSRHHSSSTHLRAAAPVDTHAPRPPKKPAAHKAAAKKHSAPVTTAVAAATTVPTTIAAVTPASPPPVTPTAPPVTAPPAEPASVLTWQSTPSALSVKAGSHVTFSVTVSNPTDGTVTLGTPLSCAPSLQPVHGAPIGGLMCEQMAQVMSPHQTLTQQYTIYATDTADASGKPLATGSYVVRVENLSSIPVTITAS